MVKNPNPPLSPGGGEKVLPFVFFLYPYVMVGPSPLPTSPEPSLPPHVPLDFVASSTSPTKAKSCASLFSEKTLYPAGSAPPFLIPPAKHHGELALKLYQNMWIKFQSF